MLKRRDTHRHPRRILIAVVLACSFSTLFAEASPQTSSSSTDKATTIGTMVRNAIGAAFPGVGTILTAIFGTGAKPNAKATQATAKDNLNDPSNKTKLQTSAQDAAKPYVAPATKIADELAVVETFASASARANEHLLTMQTLLSVSPQPSNLLKSLQEEWGLAGDILAPLFSKDMATQIPKVQDAEIQAKLLDIYNANTDVAGRIASRLKATRLEDVDLPAMKDLVSSLFKLLSGSQSMAAAELNILQQDLAALAVWANSKAQGPGPTITPDKTLIDFAGTQVSVAREVLSRIPR
jgi:hypothetical protein